MYKEILSRVWRGIVNYPVLRLNRGVRGKQNNQKHACEVWTITCERFILRSVLHRCKIKLTITALTSSRRWSNAFTYNHNDASSSRNSPPPRHVSGASFTWDWHRQEMFKRPRKALCLEVILCRWCTLGLCGAPTQQYQGGGHALLIQIFQEIGSESRIHNDCESIRRSFLFKNWSRIFISDQAYVQKKTKNTWDWTGGIHHHTHPHSARRLS